MGKAQAKEPDQLNVRSRFARVRAAQIARTTGMTLAQVVEDALRAYQPVVRRTTPNGRLVQEGRLLVLPNQGRTVTHDEVEAELDDIRSGARE